MKHRIQVSDEVALNVDDFGSGQPLVFLHGWPANNTMFEYQADFVVANGYRYIGIDHRGFGLSDRAADGYDYDTIADDIQKVVDELNLKDYIVVGFSVGGALALKYGVKHNNDNLKKMVLLGPAGPSFVQRDGYPYGLKAEDVTALIDSINDDQPKAIGDFGESSFFNSDIEVSDEYKNYFNNMTLTSSLIGTVKLAESLRDEDLREEIKSLDLPVYGIHGTADHVCPIEFSEYLEKEAPDYTLSKVEGAGHALFFEKKDEVNRLLLEALKK
ncbi:alpha/beta hydrolase [Staphylococcus condimenti]|uniref:Alpha/beta hydrolase n=1 Tax=Staphylococcus condimenti TaxID=70255 RepID=A0AB37H8F5_9STAP|nr:MULTISPECIES: alpha/beta hydrolase [Staphylococcus]AMY05282.1 alpha/beta hydrolase [Staphylococcus condimenti]APR61488.1 alpha/beta hydrolase [Staphylococcus condimenti]MDK8645289.1 alpha/beta hydrolase [Staphylococcus condimenti]OFO98744.1 alpha/beta hydrolase [Staphylococcus sp. HMSC065E08]PNZ58351.1 alpha/beta hydrolase [Staphylococcus condimenti]